MRIHLSPIPCLLCSMTQLDFLNDRSHEHPLDRSAIVERLTLVTKRPRYAYYVLELIERSSRTTGSIGPYVVDAEDELPVRDWLCDAIIAISGREPARLALAARVRREMIVENALPSDAAQAQRMIDGAVSDRLRRAGRSNISRAVSDLVKAGFVRRHYQGYAVDHHNRGAQRQAVYQVTDIAKRALRVGQAL